MKFAPKNRKVFTLLLSQALFFLPFLSAQAQTLSRIPGQESTADDLIEYLNNFYKFGLSSIAILAVFMIAVGAFTYLVLAVGNPSKMQSAKEKITNALFGLALAFLAYLMLFVINPDLVSGTIAGLSEKTQEIQNNTKGNYWNNSSASQKNNQSSNKAQCGDADGESFENKPSQDLCSQGEPTNVKEETNAWTWTCQAPEEGGEDASCYAAKEDVPQNGRCGSADQKTLIKEPEKSDLCDRGTPSQVQEESGQWTWDCQGINEGEDRSCSAEKRESTSEPSSNQEVASPYTPLQSRHNEFPEKNSGTVRVIPYYLELGSSIVDGSKFSMYVPAGTEKIEMEMSSNLADSTLYFSIDDKPIKSESKFSGDGTIESLITSDRKTYYSQGGGQSSFIIMDYSINTEGWTRGRWINFEFNNGSRPNAYTAIYRINTDHPYYYKID
ncbi:MAG: pilin [Candidatus Moranbacteria bacterium]|nr:pilin [Candidatus Moranbacteria bacterium]